MGSATDGRDGAVDASGSGAVPAIDPAVFGLGIWLFVSLLLSTSGDGGRAAIGHAGNKEAAIDGGTKSVNTAVRSPKEVVR